MTYSTPNGGTETTAHGSVAINANGTYTYTPTSNYVGTDSFTYKVTDANGATATGTVNLTVAEAANADFYTVITGAPIVVDPRTNDASWRLQNATVTAINGTAINSGQTITLASGTTVTLRSDGRLAVKAASSGGATESFNYTFTDSNGSKASTVTLTEYNDAAHAQALGFVFTVDTTKPGASNSNSITLPVNTGNTATTTTPCSGATARAPSYTGSAPRPTPMRRLALTPSPLSASLRASPSTMAATVRSSPASANGATWPCRRPMVRSTAATNLTITATDTPDLSDCTSACYMFAGDHANPNLAGADVSHITDMTGMFYNNTAFNQDISSWNTSSVTNMSNMFYGATALTIISAAGTHPTSRR